MLADRNDDLAAAIDENRGAGPHESRPEGDLGNRNRQQRHKKENDCSHVIPDKVDVPGNVSINN